MRLHCFSSLPYPDLKLNGWRRQTDERLSLSICSFFLDQTGSGRARGGALVKLRQKQDPRIRGSKCFPLEIEIGTEIGIRTEVSLFDLSGLFWARGARSYETSTQGESRIPGLTCLPFEIAIEIEIALGIAIETETDDISSIIQAVI